MASRLVTLSLIAALTVLPASAFAVKCSPKTGEPNWIGYDQIFVGTITNIEAFTTDPTDQKLLLKDTPETILSVKVEILFKGTYTKQIAVHSLPSTALMKWKVGKRYLFTTNTLQNHPTVMHCSDTQTAKTAAPLINRLQNGLAKVFEDPPSCKSSSDCRIITSYVPPVGDRPGKTTIRCQARETALSTDESVQKFQAHISKGCICEKGLCLYKN